MQRRHLLLGAAGLSAAAVLSGCSKEAGSTTTASTPASLTSVNFFTDKAAWEPSFEAMNAASKPINIELKFTGYSDPTAYDAFIKQSFRTKKVPDLFTWHTGSGLEDLVGQNLAAETTELWTKAESEGLVPTGLKDNYTVEGKQYGVPLNIAYWVMYYNKSIFAKFNLKPPTTWEEFDGICQTLLQNKVTPLHQMNIIFEFVWFQALLMGEAPEVYQKLQTGDAKYTDAEVVKVCQQWGKMIDQKYFCDPGLKTDPQTLLKTGGVAMAYFGTFFTGQLTALGMKSGTDYGVFVLPNLNPANTRPQMSLETGPIMVGRGSEREAEALAYSSWWMGTDAQAAWVKSRGDASFNPKVALDDPEVSAVIKAVADPAQNFQVQKRYLEATPTPIYTVETEEFGKFVTNGGDPMPALTKLQEAADKYWAEHK